MYYKKNQNFILKVRALIEIHHYHVISHGSRKCHNSLVFWVVPPQKKACCMSILEEIIPIHIGSLCNVYKGQSILLPPFLQALVC